MQKVEADGLECETKVHIGPEVHEFIIQEARDQGVDLIAMGTRGRTGLKGLLMGSVARKVMAQCLLSSSGHSLCMMGKIG